jgi:hypothetical protein
MHRAGSADSAVSHPKADGRLSARIVRPLRAHFSRSDLRSAIAKAVVQLSWPLRLNTHPAGRIVFQSNGRQERRPFQRVAHRSDYALNPPLLPAIRLCRGTTAR